ncbi:DUF397 domain-containing protein [Embleya sp. AB8]|uniref:DUF397 domain-containing protein n=1 Tax=Embleya sp. AB8 TaxID=3156304 RepID=UPI003C7529B6
MRTVNETKAASWRMSSYSNGQGGACVEVATGFAVVPVRDSKVPEVGHLAVGPHAWVALITTLRIS